MSTVVDAGVTARISTSFAKQGLMRTLGARLLSVAAGEVAIALPIVPAISQQHGFAHAGAVAAIADSAADYAGLTLMPAGAGVLTVEFKINLLAPAAGHSLIARGHVVKAGRTLIVTTADVVAVTDGRERLCAHLTATLMVITGREGVSD